VGAAMTLETSPHQHIHKTPDGYFEVRLNRAANEFLIFNQRGEEVAIVHIRTDDGTRELIQAINMADSLDKNFQW
jgi:hypothetical protein